ncbi:hypothetical protein AX16_003747 [Volvariella volvacea WC 439]|nr:hypothetical protein AX16_003747 [Volvariella volvacea WC 439]
MAQLSYYPCYTSHGDLSLGIFDTHSVSWTDASNSSWSMPQRRTRTKHRAGQPYYTTTGLFSSLPAPNATVWSYNSPPYLSVPESLPSPSASSPCSSTDTSSPTMYPSSPPALALEPQVPQTHVICNAPLVAPIPLPYHSPTFLQFNFLPDIDEDLSQPPYTQRIPKRKRSETDEDIDAEQLPHPMIKRLHIDPNPNSNLIAVLAKPDHLPTAPIPSLAVDSNKFSDHTPANAKKPRPPEGLRRPRVMHTLR